MMGGVTRQGGFPGPPFQGGVTRLPWSDSWYIKFSQNSLWRWLCIFIKGNNRKPQNWRLQQQQQVSVEEH